MEMDVLVIMAGHIGYRRSPVLYGSDFSRQFVGNKQSFRQFLSEKNTTFLLSKQIEYIESKKIYAMNYIIYAA